MLNLILLEKEKDVPSLQVLAKALATTLKSSVRVVQEDVLSMVVEVDIAQVTPRLMVADTTNLVLHMTVKTQMLKIMLDYQVPNHMEELQEVDASLELYPHPQALVVLVSASSTLAMVQDLVLLLVFKLALRVLLAQRKDQ
jgi:hypothetical protein